MRALRVVGLDEDGESVICEDPDNGERFTVPADERLRAAARGDLTRLGQVQIELESPVRPREIQARVRAGASVAQIAASSGLPEQRVERYAYPVLLERAQIAEMAQRAHPVREDGPDVQTLGEVVAHTFGMRGLETTEANWDAWRGDDGKWVVQLLWQAGRSENGAHWVFHPGAHGGTVAALDDHAADLLDPSPNRPLRTVRPVTELAREALELDGPETDDHSVPPPRPEATPVAETPPPGLEPTASPERTAPERPLASPVGEVTPVDEDAEPDPDDDAKAEPRRGRKNHPIVPSWEDVLLGVRSHR
ncbi:septation protein SepH [Saccharopolyspora cebuensis]|uniref:Septation protein SepH n=1 Tax=Saccharopolyspora cebuensis TaxID=418759 RepID=A0ABV4CH65_9PSEU